MRNSANLLHPSGKGYDRGTNGDDPSSTTAATGRLQSALVWR